MKRRGNNEGCIHKRKDGYWEARLPLGVNHATGRLRYKSFYAHTFEEAAARLQEARVQLANDEYVMPSAATLEQWLLKWHDIYIVGHLKPSSVQSYKTHITANIVPALGKAKLQKLTREDVQQFVNDISKTHSPASVNLTVTVLRSSLKEAVKSGIIRRNPAEGLRLPRIRNEKQVTLTQSEVKRLINALPDTTSGRILAFIARTGLRIGEASALRWRDIETDCFNVKQSVAWLGHGHKQPVFSTPKSEAGIRAIPLSGSMCAVLEAQRKSQAAERLRAGSAWQAYDLVFADPIGQPLRGSIVSSTLKHALEAAGLPITFSTHDLRHAWATAAMQSSRDAKTVSSLLGHSSVTITLNRYTHPDMDAKRALIEGLFGQ